MTTVSRLNGSGGSFTALFNATEMRKTLTPQPPYPHTNTPIGPLLLVLLCPLLESSPRLDHLHRASLTLSVPSQYTHANPHRLFCPLSSESTISTDLIFCPIMLFLAGGRALSFFLSLALTHIPRIRRFYLHSCFSRFDRVYMQSLATLNLFACLCSVFSPCSRLLQYVYIYFLVLVCLFVCFFFIINKYTNT
jgi:hypothetical protein